MKARIAFQVAATYIGAVMGAGFASGQEIQQFFTNYGYKGLVGILISALLFSALGWIMLDLQQRWKITTYPEFFKRLMGPRLGNGINVLISALLILGMIAMMSGAGALFVQYFELNSEVGRLLTALVIGLALWYRGEGVLWINTVLIPLKFVFCLGIALVAVLIGIESTGGGIPVPDNPLIQNWAFSGVLYVSFNLTLAIVVFASLGKEVQKPGARMGAVTGGIALGLFALVIGLALLRFPEVNGLEIPMVAIAGKLGGWPGFFYVVVLWLAMLTAAIGNGFSLVTRFSEETKLDYRIISLVLLVLTYFLAEIRFSSIVKVVYPLFGYLGLIFLPMLFYAWRKSRP